MAEKESDDELYQTPQLDIECDFASARNINLPISDPNQSSCEIESQKDFQEESIEKVLGFQRQLDKSRQLIQEESDSKPEDGETLQFPLQESAGTSEIDAFGRMATKEAECKPNEHVKSFYLVTSTGTIEVSGTNEAHDNVEDSLKKLEVQDERLEDVASPSAEDEIEEENYLECDDDGDTILHMAIILGKYDVAIHWIKNQLTKYLNQRNNDYQTALHLAVILRKTRIIKALVQQGADVGIQDKFGRTPLQISCEKADRETAQLLVEHEDYRGPASSIDKRDYNGETCLHVAVKRGDVAMVTLLVNNGANVNLPDVKSGRRGLHFAAEVGDVEMVKYLMTLPNIELDPKTRQGETPIILAFIQSQRSPRRDPGVSSERVHNCKRVLRLLEGSVSLDMGRVREYWTK